MYIPSISELPSRRARYVYVTMPVHDAAFAVDDHANECCKSMAR